MSRLSPPALHHLRRRVDDDRALPFATAVAVQLAHPPGTTGDETAERAAADRIARLLDAAAASDAGEALLADPALLSAVFQNLDLLDEAASPRADAVSRLLARLVDRAEAAS